MNAVKRYVLDWPFPTSGWTDAEYACDAAVCLQLHLASHGFVRCEVVQSQREFIRNVGLRGYAIGEAAPDYHNILIDSIKEGGGY